MPDFVPHNYLPSSVELLSLVYDFPGAVHPVYASDAQRQDWHDTGDAEFHDLHLRYRAPGSSSCWRGPCRVLAAFSRHSTRQSLVTSGRMGSR